jgi:hypothetical protein
MMPPRSRSPSPVPEDPRVAALIIKYGSYAYFDGMEYDESESSTLVMPLLMGMCLKLEEAFLASNTETMQKIYSDALETDLERACLRQCRDHFIKCFENPEELLESGWDSCAEIARSSSYDANGYPDTIPDNTLYTANQQNPALGQIISNWIL